MGRWYQAATNLQDRGSRTAAAAGLYHHTTTTNQLKETNSVVDLGFHYVALDANGQPMDTDGDGLADYCDPDSDGDGLSDGWELQFFGNLDQTAAGDPDEDGLNNLQEYQLGTNPTNWDTDGDGLSDSEELDIPVDVNNPALGFLNALNPDTGNTGKTDDLKDADHDAISNWGELRYYFSAPWNARTFNPDKLDSEYFHTARGGERGLALANLEVAYLGGNRVRFAISGAFPHALYDLYFVNSLLAQRWQWRRVFSGIHCDEAGESTFVLERPDPQQGYFVILSAEDTDEDGLTDGYEAWFNYSGRRTLLDDPESDGDGMDDGWEVAYGLDPTDKTGINGAQGDPDGDGISNLSEFDFNPRFAVPWADPRKHYFQTPSRPVVSVSSSAPEAYKVGGTASFTIRRSIGGFGANLNSPLLVYFSGGGTATYGTDYTLSPAPYTEAGDPGHPDGYPRIFLAKIPAGQDSVTVTVTPIGSGVQQAGSQSIVIKLTPYGVAVNPQTQDPLQWGYVVNLFEEAATLRIHNGILINLEKTPTGYLRIKPTANTTPLPFINVANSGWGTLARIYAGENVSSDPSRVAGEYLTKPGGGGDPSRTTVDRYGNVWVGNRAVGDEYGGSIAQIGVVMGGTRCDADGSPNPNGDYLKPPFIYNTCVDRHGATVNDPPDGLIKTSRGGGSELTLDWPDNEPDSLGGVSQAEDEAILCYVRVAPTAVRTIIVDPNNNVWVGSKRPRQEDTPPGNHWHEFIDGVTGMPVTGWRVNFQGGGYGGVIDGHGAIWSSGYDRVADAFRLIRFLPATTMPLTNGGTIRGTGDNYGITVDPNTGDVWQALYSSANVMHFRTNRCTTRFQIGLFGNRGLVIDGRGNIWVGGSARTIFHLTTSGHPVGRIHTTFTPPDQSIIVGEQPIGVTVDHLGKIWAICWTANDGHGWAMRIDPVGRRVVEAVDLGYGAGPYNYSDMSGFVALSATQPAGVWDYVVDGGADHQLWESLTMDAEVPTGTRIIVEVRAATNLTELPAWPFRPVVNAHGVTPSGTTALPAGIKGRYLEVRANLLRDFGVTQSPELRNLTVQHGVPGCALQITAHPKSRAVAPGANVSFNVAVQVPGGATPTYQWLKDGVAIAGATGPSLTINNAYNMHAGRYSVKVGATTGCGTFQLESAPARLHVKGNPPVVP